MNGRISIRLTGRILWLVSCTTLVCSSLLAQGPVANWPFSGNANDMSGNGHHGTVNNATLVSDRFGNPNSAYYFNGQNARITVPGATDFRWDSTQPYTIVVWFKVCDTMYSIWTCYGPPIMGTLRPPLACGYAMDLSPLRGGWSIDLHTSWNGRQQAAPIFVWYSDYWRFYVMSNMFLPAYGRDATRMNDGRWHMYAFRQNIAGTRPATQFFDANSFTDVVAGSALADFSSNTTDLVFGYESVNGLYLKGAIDDARIYHRALTDTEILALYSEGGWSGTTPAGTVRITNSPGPVVCAGESLRLQTSATGAAVRYRWRPSTGLSDSTSPSPTARPLVTTTYRVTAYSDEPCPEELASDTITVRVSPGPRMQLTNTIYACSGTRRRIGGEVTGGAPPYRFEWSPAIGLSSTSEQYPEMEAIRSERYIVTITDAAGCVGRDSVMVTVLPRPSARAGADRQRCGSETLTLGDTTRGGNPPYRWRWVPSAGLDDSTRQFPVARPDTSTTYILEVTDATGCTGLDTIVVTVSPAARADAGADVSVCSGEGIGIGSPALPGYSYAWSPTEGLSGTAEAQPVAAPSRSTTYTVVAMSPWGCQAIDSVRVTVLAPRLSATVSSLDFGLLDGCTSARELELELANEGDSDLELFTSESAGSDFVLVTSLPLRLGPGQRRMVVVRFAPGRAGASTDTLVLTSRPCRQQVRIALKGYRESSLVWQRRASLDFGRHLWCELPDTTLEVWIGNGGSEVATIEGVPLEHPLRIELPALPMAIAPGDSLRIVVSYRPSGEGGTTQELRLPYRLGTCSDTLRVLITGLVEHPRLEPDQTAIDFGLLDGCAERRDTTIELSNGSDRPMTVTRIIAPTGFSTTTQAPAEISAGGSLGLSVRFQPGGSGASAGDLLVLSEPCGDTLRIALQGRKLGVSFTLPDTIDFGEVNDCDPGSAVRQLSVAYVGEAPGRISDVDLQGDFSTTVVPGDELRSGEPKEYAVTAGPVNPGPFAGRLYLTLEPCAVRREIVLLGSYARVRLETSGLDFGTHPVGIAVRGDVEFTNSGEATVTVTGVVPPGGAFTIEQVSPAPPLRLAPGEQLTVGLRYDPEPGQSVETLRVELGEPCDREVGGEIRGRGEAGASVSVALPHLSAAAGERVRIPLVMTSSRGLDAAGARRFEAVISFDRTLLVAPPGVASSTDATRRRVRLTGERATSDTLGVIELIATLGSAEHTDLQLDTLIWQGALQPVSTRLLAGRFDLSGICREGGVRLYDGTGEAALRRVVPNPTQGSMWIEYELSETGRTRLELIDATGRPAGFMFDEDREPGVYAQAHDATGLPAGSYLLVLRTPTLVLTKRLEVYR